MSRGTTFFSFPLRTGLHISTTIVPPLCNSTALEVQKKMFFSSQYSGVHLTMHEIGQNYYYTLSHMTKAYRLQHDDDGSIEWYIVREQITKSLAIE